MITNLSRDEMEAMAATHVCQCGGLLTVAHGGHWGHDGPVLRCANDITHSNFIRPYVPTMGNTPGLAGWKLSNRRKAEMETTLGPVRAGKLRRHEGVALLSKEDLADIISTLWPKAPDPDRKKAMYICWQLRLNPLMKHVHLIPFKDSKTGETTWVIALGIGATRTLAVRQRRYGYIENTPRLMTEAEEIEDHGAVDPSRIWYITKLRDEYGNIAKGVGFWPRAVAAYGADKGNSVYNMAGIRSERKAFDRLLPDVIPPDLEVIDERYGVQEQMLDKQSEEITMPQSSEPARPEVVAQAGPPLSSQGPETVSPSSSTDPKPPAPAPGKLTRAEIWHNITIMMPHARATFETIALWCNKQGVKVTAAELTTPEPPAVVTDEMIGRIMDIFQTRLDEAKTLALEGK